MDLAQWHRYASCWSLAEAERLQLLSELAASSVTYRDPAAEVIGRAELSGYMAGFQQGYPNNRFQIFDVKAHHDRSLARWRWLAADDSIVIEGASRALHDADGRFQEIDGFFLGEVPAPQLG